MIYFTGAGPGAEDLITVRGMRLIQEADIIIYAGSLVNPGLLKYAKKEPEIYNSALMTLEEVTDIMIRADGEGKDVVRLHTGDQSIYGAVREQMDILDRNGIKYESCPGVSACFGAAAALDMEYTLPDVTQTLIITRMEGVTAVPDRESIEKLSSHGSSMAVYLSAGMMKELSERLMAGGYEADTPAAIVYKATFPDEKKIVCTVGELAERAGAHGITKTAVVLIGDAIAHRDYERSKLYDPSFETGFRKADGREQTLMGKIYVIGIGPGDKAAMTEEAVLALKACDVIVGYKTYVDLIRECFPGKDMLESPMRSETERCRKCIELAKEGKTVALICSGDSGVYGMASPMLEIGASEGFQDIEIIPGVTAALSGAALLGAPLGHDFCTISLSDLLTPWEVIEERLRCAAKGDFSIVLYNPSSNKRAGHLEKACRILLELLPEDRVCGYVKNIGRSGCERGVCTLSELADINADMATTVFIGNRSTCIRNGRLITPRGYKL